MRSLKNHKAAGGDGIPSELLKYSGGMGVQVLTHLFNAILSTRCVPSAWRKGVVVHLAKGGDGGDCSNYRPLTLLPIIDKLFAKLLSERISRVVCLHDQQYAFRPGRGTLNSLHNLLRLRLSMSLQSSRPRPEQSPKRSSWRMRCATSPRRYAAASHGRSSPRRRYKRA